MPNEEMGVTFATVRFGRVASPDERAGVEAALRERGATVAWRASARAGRTYGLAWFPDGSVAAAPPATVHDAAIIALALFPTVPEALPQLLEAFGGAGRPAALLSCEPCDGGVVVEWNPRSADVALLFALADAELQRYRSGRTVELLAPLPPDVVASIAAEGLSASGAGPDRELETLLERAGLDRA